MVSGETAQGWPSNPGARRRRAFGAAADHSNVMRNGRPGTPDSVQFSSRESPSAAWRDTWLRLANDLCCNPTRAYLNGRSSAGRSWRGRPSNWSGLFHQLPDRPRAPRRRLVTPKPIAWYRASFGGISGTVAVEAFRSDVRRFVGPRSPGVKVCPCRGTAFRGVPGRQRCLRAAIGATQARPPAGVQRRRFYRLKFKTCSQQRGRPGSSEDR